MTVTYQLEDLQTLANLNLKVYEAGKVQMEQLATEIITTAKQLVPVRTGRLQNSIRKETGPEDETFYSVKVIAGNAQAHYALFVEAKQPFMRPAVEMNVQGFKEKLSLAITEVMQP